MTKRMKIPNNQSFHRYSKVLSRHVTKVVALSQNGGLSKTELVKGRDEPCRTDDVVYVLQETLNENSVTMDKMKSLKTRMQTQKDSKVSREFSLNTSAAS